MKRKQTPGALFLSGAGLRSWIWSDVASLVETDCLAAEYPGREKGDEPGSISLNDYVEFVLSQLSRWNREEVIIVAHSIGGVIGMELASRLGTRLAGFVAVGGAIPKPGDSFLSLQPFFTRILLRAVLRFSGTKPPDSMIAKGLCNDLSGEQTERIVASFVPESIEIYRQKNGSPIPTVRRLYVRLTADRQMSLELQNRMVEILHPDRVVDLATGHLPMLADPAALASVLNRFLRE